MTSPFVNGKFVPQVEIDLGEVTSPIVGLEGGFTPYGIINKWYSGVFFGFMTQGDASVYGAKLVEPLGESGWTNVWFKDYKQAQEAAKADGQKYGPQRVWRVTGMVSDALNIDPDHFQNSPSIIYSVNLMGPDSAKRHAYHLMALPSSVWAAAQLAGIDKSDLPENPLSELLGKEVIFDESLELGMIGIPSAKKGEEGYWLDSKLGKFRKDLWGALGESDPLKWSNNPASGEKVVTKAEGLAWCLQFAGNDWTKPTWARMVSIPDPLLGSTYTNKTSGDVKRNRVGVIWELFSNQAEAKRAADEQAKDKVETEVSGVGQPQLPSGWEGMADDFIASFTSACKPGRQMRDIASDLSMPPALVPLWKKYLQIQ